MTSLLKKVAYAKDSISNLASDILEGKEISAPKEIIEMRRSICNGCDKKKTICTMEFCKECGCSLDVKTSGASFHCPLNKWDKF